MKNDDKRFMRATFEIARHARNRGNHPFGTVLVDENGHIVMEAENTVVIAKDCTGHAEANLMRRASSNYDYEFMAKCTIYTSTEPCPMCAGAIFWANVRRVVFGLSQQRLYDIVGWNNDEVLYLPCRELFGRGQKTIEVIGPIPVSYTHLTLPTTPYV